MDCICCDCSLFRNLFTIHPLAEYVDILLLSLFYRHLKLQKWIQSRNTHMYIRVGIYKYAFVICHSRSYHSFFDFILFRCCCSLTFAPQWFVWMAHCYSISVDSQMAIIYSYMHLYIFLLSIWCYVSFLEWSTKKKSNNKSKWIIFIVIFKFRKCSLSLSFAKSKFLDGDYQMTRP